MQDLYEYEIILLHSDLSSNPFATLHIKPSFPVRWITTVPAFFSSAAPGAGVCVGAARNHHVAALILRACPVPPFRFLDFMNDKPNNGAIQWSSKWLLI
jgi:hypothetical protein